MLANHTFDIVSTLDGFASFEGGGWGRFWGKGGPELLDDRLAAYSEEQRLVLGRTPTGSSWSCWARAPRQKSWTR